MHNFLRKNNLLQKGKNSNNVTKFDPFARRLEDKLHQKNKPHSASINPIAILTLVSIPSNFRTIHPPQLTSLSPRISECAKVQPQEAGQEEPWKKSMRS